MRSKRIEYNGLVVKELIERYGFKRNYILMSIRGDRDGTIPRRIREEYHMLNEALTKTLKEKAAEL